MTPTQGRWWPAATPTACSRARSGPAASRPSHFSTTRPPPPRPRPTDPDACSPPPGGLLGPPRAFSTLRPTSASEVGTPGSAQLTIRDNDLYVANIRVGTGQLTPAAAELPDNGKITYDVKWTVPQPSVWRDLNTIEFRLVDNGIAVAWLKWDETTNALSLRDPLTGLFSESGQPGSKATLRAGDVD